MRTPTASNTALAIAGATGVVTDAGFVNGLGLGPGRGVRRRGLPGTPGASHRPGHQPAEMRLPGDAPEDERKGGVDQKQEPELAQQRPTLESVPSLQRPAQPDPEQTEDGPGGSDCGPLAAQKEEDGAADTGRGEKEADERQRPHPPLDLRAQNPQRPHVEQDVGERGVEQHRSEEPPQLTFGQQEVHLRKGLEERLTHSGELGEDDGSVDQHAHGEHQPEHEHHVHGVAEQVEQQKADHER